MSLNLAYILRESAARLPDKPAVLFDGGRLTYAQLDALSDRFAHGLAAAGFEPGDRVGLQLPNLPQFVIAYFGILKAGCIAVPMNVLLKAPEIAFQLGNSRARGLITWAGIVGEAAKAAEAAQVAHLYVVNTPGMPAATVGTPFEALLDSDPGLPAPMVHTEPGDTAVVIYTSGTTGTPKGAELTHFQLLMNADTPGRVFGVRDDDVELVALPLFHVFGLSSQLNVAVRFGATLSLMPRFEPAAALEIIRRDTVTIFVGVPTMYIAMLAHAEAAGVDPEDIASLRIGISGGAALPAEVIDAFEARFGVLILEGYGLTETASTTTFNISAEERRVYSVGKPIWGVNLQIWDTAGTPLPRGSEHVGEIVVSGVNLLKGYFDDEASTAAAFTRGWFHTGDLGYVDEDGFVFVVDRLKDLVIRGGYNVYPREIEEVLYTHPGILEAAVIGVPDARLGEEVKAFVTPRAGVTVTPDEIIAFTKERIAAYKYPRLVEIRAEMAHGPTGKILKTLLR